jgi:hypothetical protein
MLRVLITNNTLAQRAGSELYVRDLARALLDRGHAPIAYSTIHGEVADELRADLPVVDDLAALGTPPDIIHGQHHVETMTALLRFPDVPAVYVYHGWRPWEETPPQFPRIRHYVAVSDPGRDRLVFQYGVPENRVRTLPNFVDLARFQPRDRPLPTRPERALFFSNHVSDHALSIVREACAQTGMALDAVGIGTGNSCERPEAALGSYDLVFATGRSALEAIAVGAAVVLCDALTLSGGPLVTTHNLAQLRSLNFAGRVVREPLSASGVVREIAQYQPADAEAVSRCIRATAGRDDAVDQLVALYREAVTDWQAAAGDRGVTEWHAAATYLRQISTRIKQVDARLQEAYSAHQAAYSGLQAECHRLRGELAALQTERDRLEAARGVLERTATLRLRNRLLRIPLVRGLAQTGVRMAARLFAPVRSAPTAYDPPSQSGTEHRGAE